MISDDIIYVALLLVCIAVGPFYRKLRTPQEKQWFSTGFGLSLITIVSGRHVLHPLVSLLVNALIITKLPRKSCHLVSLLFSFFYLLVIFRLGNWFGLPTPPSHTNLIQMILTLKLPGLAFELNAAITASDDDPRGERNAAVTKVTFLDVIHYGLSYMGVLTGPYYRYRTYWDSLHRPLSDYLDPRPLTYYKLKQATVLSILFLIMNYVFPATYTTSEEYEERSFLIKWLYIYPIFATFRLRLFAGVILSECVCQMAGLGVYPSDSNPQPGMGPQNYKAVELLISEPEKLKMEKYDFETVHNMNLWEIETCSQVRTCMKYWNACIQYWMAVYVYKRFPVKALRTVVTLTTSALWHGYSAGYYFCICFVPLYLPLEDLCMKFCKQHEKDSNGWKIWSFTLWFMRLTCMAYLGIPFLLLDLYEILRFYKNLYYFGHVLGAVLYIVGRCSKPYILKRDKEKDKE